MNNKVGKDVNGSGSCAVLRCYNLLVFTYGTEEHGKAPH